MRNEDGQLIARGRAGDRAALGTLYDRHSTRVYGLLFRLTGNAAEAEDLAQETFLSAFRSLADWRGEGAFSTWLCGIACRLHADFQRRKGRRLTEPLDADVPAHSEGADPLQLCARRETQAEIEQAIAALPAGFREVFVLVKVEGFSYREAATLLQLPLGTVQSRLWRAVALLQSALRELDPARSPAEPVLEVGSAGPAIAPAVCSARTGEGG